MSLCFFHVRCIGVFQCGSFISNVNATDFGHRGRGPDLRGRRRRSQRPRTASTKIEVAKRPTEVGIGALRRQKYHRLEAEAEKLAAVEVKIEVPNSEAISKTQVKVEVTIEVASYTRQI